MTLHEDDEIKKRDHSRAEQALALCDRTACQARWVGYLLVIVGVLLPSAPSRTCLGMAPWTSRTLRSLPMQEQEWQRQWRQA
jgi:hypothetical protein